MRHEQAPSLPRSLAADLLVAAFAWGLLASAAAGEWLGPYGPSGQLEVAAVILTGLSVWLAVRNSLWTWPVGILGTSLYLILFFEWRLYADAGLQVVYICLGFVGLAGWLRRRRAHEREGEPEAERSGVLHLVCLAGLIALGTLAIREYLIAVGGAAPFWDALLTSGSLGAQYLLIRKRIESWTLWAMLDVAYVGLFAERGYYLTAALYLLFLGMVIRAAFSWRRLLVPQAPAREAV